MGYICVGFVTTATIALTSLFLKTFLLRHKSKSDFEYTLALILVMLLFSATNEASILVKCVLRHKSKPALEYKLALKSRTLLFSLLKSIIAALIDKRSPDKN